MPICNIKYVPHQSEIWKPTMTNKDTTTGYRIVNQFIWITISAQMQTTITGKSLFIVHHNNLTQFSCKYCPQTNEKPLDQPMHKTNRRHVLQLVLSAIVFQRRSRDRTHDRVTCSVLRSLLSLEKICCQWPLSGVLPFQTCKWSGQTKGDSKWYSSTVRSP